MRPIVSRTFLLLALAGAGCTRSNPLAIDPDGGTGCGAHTDPASCNADASCVLFTCPDCHGGSSFAGCFDKSNPPPLHCATPSCGECHGLDQTTCAANASRGCVVAECCGGYLGCLDPGEGFGCTCSSCDGLGEQDCNSRPDCRADYCPTCDGNQVFAQCSNPTDPPTECAQPPCPLGCDQATSASECDAIPSCHSVYEPGGCGCADCCCTFFSRCAQNQFADCKGPAFCNSAPPDCGELTCNNLYTVSYANNCYEGCVLQSECAP